MQLRRVVLHCLLRVEHKGIFVIFNLDRVHALRGGNFVLGDDNGDVVPVVTDVLVEQQPVGYVLVMRIGRPGVSGCWERKIRYVKACEHFNDAWNLLGFGCVHLCDHAVGDGGVIDFYDERAFVGKIVRIPGAACYLVDCVYAFDAFSYDHSTLLISLSLRAFTVRSAKGRRLQVCWCSLF